MLVDGIHDLGGMQGLGAVDHSPAEPVFRHRWEAVARALLAVVAGAVEASGGEFRHSIERMEPGCPASFWMGMTATLWLGMSGDGKGPAGGFGGALWCPGCRGGGQVVAVSRSRG